MMPKVLILLYLISSQPESVTKSPPWHITVVPTHKVFDVLEPVVLVIEVENVSGATQYLEVSNPWQIDVTWNEHETVQTTKYGRGLETVRTIGGHTFVDNPARFMAPVGPEEAWSSRVHLSRRVDMSRVGQYTVRLRRWASGGALIEAEPISVVVGDQTNLQHVPIDPEVLQEAGVASSFGTRFPRSIYEVVEDPAAKESPAHD
jgi:hypothetical protein